MNLSEWARRQGVSYQTAWRWVKNGRMPVPVHQAPSGTWIVEEGAQAEGRTVAYCRVASADQKADLDRQVSRVVQEGTTQGWSVTEVVTETDSGLNGRRRKLHRLLADPDVSVIVVQHRDRLARLGVEHLETAPAASGRRLVMLDEEESPHDVARDMTEALASMCARLYGHRSAKHRARATMAAAAADPGGTE